MLHSLLLPQPPPLTSLSLSLSLRDGRARAIQYLDNIPSFFFVHRLSCLLLLLKSTLPILLASFGRLKNFGSVRQEGCWCCFIGHLSSIFKGNLGQKNNNKRKTQLFLIYFSLFLCYLLAFFFAIFYWYLFITFSHHFFFFIQIYRGENLLSDGRISTKARVHHPGRQTRLCVSKAGRAVVAWQPSKLIAVRSFFLFFFVIVSFLVHFFIFSLSAFIIYIIIIIIIFFYLSRPFCRCCADATVDTIRCVEPTNRSILSACRMSHSGAPVCLDFIRYSLAGMIRQA